MKIKPLYICTLVIFSVGFYFIGSYMHQSTSVSIPSGEYGPDFTAPTPYLHLVYGEGGCPNVDTSDDYVCIANLASTTLAEANTLAQKLIQASPGKNTEQMAGFYDDLHANVRSAQKARDAYFDAVCGLDEMLIYGGSGMDLEQGACRYYYARQYLHVLQKLEVGL